MAIDSSRVFYGLGAVFGFFALIYLGVEVLSRVSPLVTSAIWLTLSLVLFASTELTVSTWKKMVQYFFGFLSYLIFAAYTLIVFNLGSAGTLLFLLISSLFFIAVGYGKKEKDLDVSGDKAKYFILFAVILLAGISLYDIAGPDAEIGTELRPSVNLSQTSDSLVSSTATVGTLKASNSFIFPRTYDVPNYDACVGEDGNADISIEDGKDMLFQGEEVEMDIEIIAYADEEFNFSREYEVVSTEECVREEGQISFFER